MEGWQGPEAIDTGSTFMREQGGSHRPRARWGAEANFAPRSQKAAASARGAQRHRYRPSLRVAVVSTPLRPIAYLAWWPTRTPYGGMIAGVGFYAANGSSHQAPRRIWASSNRRGEVGNQGRASSWRNAAQGAQSIEVTQRSPTVVHPSAGQLVIADLMPPSGSPITNDGSLAA